MTSTEASARPLPTWFADARLGIFVHWGAYSVPAWAEPIGELGAVGLHRWFAHNPYAEWYANTIRFPRSPAAAHHREVWGGIEYDEFLDRWTAEAFDADGLIDLFASAGARYVVPTTKHHDGIALWDAPGTGTRNTVHRGPRRDIIGEFAEAARSRGIGFGTYYSGGIDWSFRPQRRMGMLTPTILGDAEYAAYAAEHVRDLIRRYEPDLIWNDISWPRAGRADLARLFEEYYAAVPHGVVNDRWGVKHADFRTSEYKAFAKVEDSGRPWEHTRGLGYSFGYNQVEDASHSLDGAAVVRLLVDVVSRGGNLLLNVGPDASGRIPPLQRAALEYLADWRAANGHAVWGSERLDRVIGAPGEEPWARWTRTGRVAHLVLAGPGVVAADPRAFELASARRPDGGQVTATAVDGGIRIDLTSARTLAPVLVDIDLLAGTVPASRH